MTSRPSRDSVDNEHGGNASNRTRCGCGAPFPPRPKAIATFLSTADFMPGCQTLLYSVKTHMTPTPEHQYPPEIIVLLSSSVISSEASKCNNLLYPTLCDRIIPVKHIPVTENGNMIEGKTCVTNNQKKSCHVQSWDDHCGYTKLRVFEMECYDTILYIDADCLVVKDVSHLLYINDVPMPSSNSSCHAVKRMGLLAAAPDIFPPDKFNAGVMVLRPSKAVFDQMISRLSTPSSCGNDSTDLCTSYDGGDTGFLNSFYPGWFHDMPSYSRLPFGYNAQRFMYHCTYSKQPRYWDDAIEDLRIIHFSSSPKPWKMSSDVAFSETRDHASYLSGKDTISLQMAKCGKLESIWQEAYKRSQQYLSNEHQKQSSLIKRSVPQHKLSTPSAAPFGIRKHNPHSLAQKRYRELRKSGMDIKEAMFVSRKECGLDKADIDIDAGKAVGKMFGLM